MKSKKNSKAKYLNPAIPVEDRVKNLLSQMTIEEKIAQMGCCYFQKFMNAGNSELIEDMVFSKEKADSLIGQGIGHISFLPNWINKTPRDHAELINEIQRYLVNDTRLGIPAIIHGECIGGLVTRGATHYPASIGLGSTWEPDLVRKMSGQIRKQMRAVGLLQALSPNLDISRDPRWGRVEETYGEDACLCSRMGVSFVKGLQGGNLSNGVAATGKHFVGHGMSEGGLNHASVKLPIREILEHFIIPFEAAIKEADIASIMPAYHDMDGIPVTSSRELLTDLLRSKLGFKGYIVTDYHGMIFLKTHHHIAETPAEAGKLALSAGVDVELPAGDCWGKEFTEEVKRGSIPMDLIDLAVSRHLALKFKLGLFDNPYVESRLASNSFGTKEQKELACHLAKKSIILLKNDKNILPLKKDIKSIAVIGPNADNLRHQVGMYSYSSFQEFLRKLPEMAKKAGDSMPLPVPESTEGKIDFSGVTILEGIKEKTSSQTEILYAEGCKVLDGSTRGFTEAIEKAKKADIAVMVAGGRSGFTHGNTNGETKDRAHIDLPGVQGQLVKAVSKTKTPIILVLVNGRPFGIPELIDLSSAVVETWLPGEQGGNAVADVLFGDYNPGGKLPITIPRNSGQIPVYYNHKACSGMSYLDIDYVDMPASPLFCFGYGLSYTEFEFSNLRINKEKVEPLGEIEISLDVENIGRLKGEEVVQLYINDMIASVSRPVKELKGFRRVSLKPGEKRTVIFTLYMPQLAFYDRDMKFIVEPGDFKIMIGSSSQDIKLTGEFKVVGEDTEIEDKIFFSSNECFVKK